MMKRVKTEPIDPIIISSDEESEDVDANAVWEWKIPVTRAIQNLKKKQTLVIIFHKIYLIFSLMLY
jgi:hypothetical protein